MHELFGSHIQVQTPFCTIDLLLHPMGWCWYLRSVCMTVLLHLFIIYEEVYGSAPWRQCGMRFVMRTFRCTVPYYLGQSTSLGCNKQNRFED